VRFCTAGRHGAEPEAGARVPRPPDTRIPEGHGPCNPAATRVRRGDHVCQVVPPGGTRLSFCRRQLSL